MSPLKFTIEKKMAGKLGRAGVLETPHGKIETPAFVTVGTKATVKALSPEQVKAIYDAEPRRSNSAELEVGALTEASGVVLANTYHLYLQPGDETLKKAGGLHNFMNWQGPTMTDSGGFQAFSLGAAFGTSVSKIAIAKNTPLDVGHPMGVYGEEDRRENPAMAKVTEDGVTFKSPFDGSEHHFTPEKSIAIQHNIGADMIFAFDECTSPHASYEYQKEAMDRTHRWAERSLAEHQRLRERSDLGNSKRSDLEDQTPKGQALLGIVQGGRFEDLRKESAQIIGLMDFDGFGIGGSFDKEDMYTVVGWVNEILPEEKPRHLLGIGEPADLFGGIENGCDLFDCVAPTRMGRNGTIHTKNGKINILNAKFKDQFIPIEEGCGCYTCKNYTRAYIAHLFRAKEMFAATLASIHNLYFIVNLVKKIRQSILDERFEEYKKEFLCRYK